MNGSLRVVSFCLNWLGKFGLYNLSDMLRSGKVQSFLLAFDSLTNLAGKPLSACVCDPEQRNEGLQFCL